MKNEVWVGKKGYRYWYYRFRDSEYYALVLIVLTIAVCITLVFYILIPELSNWFSVREEINATQQKIAILQQNISFMNSLDKGRLNAQLLTTSHALPPQKDFAPMLQALSNAAAKSGISMNDYAFGVGNIDSAANQASTANAKGLSFIQISVVVTGNIDGVRRFIKSIENSLPLAEVVSIDGSGENVTVTIQFYQKPFPKINFTGETRLESVSADKLNLIQKLSTWDTSTGTQPVQSASGSATPLF